jgi:dTDP-N-acetylfucosamine:lipid II N-acetylfucosaminyltransferase
MILHLVEDEKVINRTIDLFKKVNKGNNKFLIDIPNEQYQLQHVKTTEFTVSAVFDSQKYWTTVGDVSLYEAIIFHSLTHNTCKLIQRYQNTTTPFAWILWGSELYNYLATKGYRLYLWKPSFLRLKLRRLFYDPLMISIKNISAKIRKEESIEELYGKAFQRINYCCIFNKGDYNLLKSFADTTAKWLWFNYYPIDTILGPALLNKKVNGNNIFLGNSGSITGNHIPAYKLLKELKLQNRKVIVPLSYGNERYRQFLVKKGNEILGDSFTPLKDFMPLDEYNKYLCSASIVIMFHLRQEAVGNILIALYLGAKVYLREENNLYEYFNSIGVNIFSINKDLTPNNKEALQPLPEAIQQENRKKILDEFNEERIIKRTQLLLQEVLS